MRVVDVFGFEAAARHWYGKPAAKLSRSEAARLVALLPSPQRRSPQGKEGSAKVVWLERNRVPFPGERGFDQVQEGWSKAPWPWQCF